LHFQKVFKSNSKPKSKVENDLEIEKIPKYLILEFLVKHHIFGLSKKFSKFCFSEFKNLKMIWRSKKSKNIEFEIFG
jgi:hypothetical protein